MSTELEGADLFDAAARAIGKFDAMFNSWVHEKAKYLLVAPMLEWLRGRGAWVILDDWHTEWRASNDAPDGRLEVFAPDLPTALARLVLRVNELEQPAKGEGEKQ